jgi:hypothetical protein
MMIPFKMKILNYNTGGSYSVEYVPTDENCTPVKLDIRIDTATTSNPTEVLDLLKNSSPQSFWESEISNRNVDHDTLRKLVNTVHSVGDTGQSRVTTGYSSPTPISAQVGPNNQNSPALRGAEGYTHNQQIANNNEQQLIRLKVIIQQVIQEMAEGTI